MTIKNEILREFTENKQQTITMISAKTGRTQAEVADCLRLMRLEGLVEKTGRTEWTILSPTMTGETMDNPLIPKDVLHLDYDGTVSKLRKCYQMKINALLIGPAGVGKTSAIRKVGEMESVPMRTTNFSLRTREHHFMGRLDTRPDGTLYFKPGPLVLSMVEGGIWYADELNQAEADSLVRTDEALDFRRMVEIEGEQFKASDKFWSVASINPLDRYHPGTKELPGQLLRRFPVRIFMGYPPPSTEFTIVKMHCPAVTDITSRFIELIAAINQMRESPDLPYHPTMSETITLAQLLTSGIGEREAVTMTLIDVYSQWGSDTVLQVSQLLHSRLGIKFDKEEHKFPDPPSNSYIPTVKFSKATP